MTGSRASAWMARSDGSRGPGLEPGRSGRARQRATTGDQVCIVPNLSDAAPPESRQAKRQQKQGQPRRRPLQQARRGRRPRRAAVWPAPGRFPRRLAPDRARLIDLLLRSERKAPHDLPLIQVHPRHPVCRCVVHDAGRAHLAPEIGRPNAALSARIAKPTASGPGHPSETRSSRPVSPTQVHWTGSGGPRVEVPCEHVAGNHCHGHAHNVQTRLKRSMLRDLTFEYGLAQELGAKHHGNHRPKCHGPTARHDLRQQGDQHGYEDERRSPSYYPKRLILRHCLPPQEV
jgi:hypothetical protein